MAPVSSRSTTAIYANENWATTVTGITEQFFPLSNRRMHEGRAFTASESKRSGLTAEIAKIAEETGT